MSTTRTSWLPAAQSAGWFQLTRHDDPEPTEPEPTSDPAADPPDPDPEPDPTDDPAEPEPDPDPEGADRLGDAGKKALDKMKAEKAAAKKEAAEERRKAAALAKKVQDFEDRDKSELEKAASKAERAQEQAAKAVARAVQAEVRGAAREQFADAGDAVDVLMRDPSKYVDDSGDINTDAIEADLADLLERKPHWAKSQPAVEPAPVSDPAPAKPRLRPDPGQGPRPGVPAKNFLDASKDEVAAELAKVGYRQRS